MLIHTYGDSNTARWPNSITGTPWPERFGARLVGEEEQGEVVINRGVGGQRMHMPAGVYAEPGVRWPAIETYAITDLEAADRGHDLPDKIIVCAGTNDIPLEWTPTAELPDFVESFQILDNTVQDRWGIEMWVISIMPFRVAEGSITSDQYWARLPRWKSCNQSLRTLFEPTGRYVDTSQEMTDANGQLLPGLAMPDGFHINAWGHVQVADLIPLAPFQD